MFHIPSIAQKPTGALLWAFTQGRWAIVWMCRNQLGRRNITDEQQTYLIGEAYRAQKMTRGGDRRSEEFSNCQNGSLKKYENKAQEIAEEFGVGERSVLRAGMFADGLDAAETVSAGFKDAVRSGAVTAPDPCGVSTGVLWLDTYTLNDQSGRYIFPVIHIYELDTVCSA